MDKFFNKYKGQIYLLSLFVFCCLLYFFGLGDYGLIDIDETRYVNIARNMLHSGNYITPYLNFEPFLEKPPLFYYFTVFSYKLFGVVNNFTSRFSVALLGMFGVFSLYFFVSKISKSRTLGFLSAIILMSSFWYALFCHIAILDSGFTVFVNIAFFFGVATLFCEKVWCKRILWYFGYLFLGLSVLQKGLIGIIVPGLSLLIVFIYFKRVKEIIKPDFIIPGVIIFLLTVLPWHYSVFHENGFVWFREYIIKHHFARFLNSSMDIGRKRSLFFYIPVVIGGFLPWAFFFIAGIIKKGKSIFYEKNLLSVAMIHFLVIFIFFSISSTKLPTYILTVFPAISIITAYFWRDYLKASSKNMKLASILTLLLFLTAGIAGLICYFTNIIEIGLRLSVLFILFAISGFIFLFKRKRKLLFSMFVLFTVSVFFVSGSEIFNYIRSFGQNELEEYAQIAKENNASLLTLNFSKKYSILNYYDKKVYFIPDIDDKYIIFIETIEDLKPPVYLITKNKKKYAKNFLEYYELIKKGKKYSLYEVE